MFVSVIIAIFPEGNEEIYYDIYVFFFPTLLKLYNGNEEIVIVISRG
jgi:hypothetical protein